MNQFTTAKDITIDWDDISINEAMQRVDFISKEYINVRKLVLSLSPLSGFHCRISFYHPVLVAKVRKMFKDDGNRLVNDLLNRNKTRKSVIYDGVGGIIDDNYHGGNNIRDILWRRKNYAGLAWEEKDLMEYEHVKSC